MLPKLTEIAKRRKALDLTQAKLADKVSEIAQRLNYEQTKLVRAKGEVSRGLIAKVENNYLIPNYQQAKNIFDALEVLENEELSKKKAIMAGQIHNMPIEYANASEHVLDVWKRMEDKAYSQAPVKGDVGIVGSITERGITSRMLTMGLEELRSLRVRDIMGESFPTVGMNTPIEAIIPLLQANQAILTIKGDKIVGIITNTDLMKIFKLNK